ncbi:DUF7701 domain-containing protein [Streptacidiphilus fuscans]|uniref:DUF7701 domain-containing protein n=1 Tax=Streptacidiphilus fuscans TaxID=2789292 RepID=A0A931AYI3_9ACTN|nr:hypothetical protein [Streptacidiphilus fuscans]MBF9066898.1 hypothetical protein [Streptacidiphilus fuscans]
MSPYLSEDAALIRSLLPSAAQPPGDDDALFLGYAVLMRAKGTQTTAEDVHDTWSAWMLGREPDHPAIVPFEQLPARTQAMDLPYMQAIHTAAQQRTTAGGL